MIGRAGVGGRVEAFRPGRVRGQGSGVKVEQSRAESAAGPSGLGWLAAQFETLPRCSCPRV